MTAFITKAPTDTVASGTLTPETLTMQREGSRQQITAATVDDRYVVVTWADGHESRYFHLWLRDNCDAAESRDPVSGQRLVDAAELPDDLAVRELSPSEDALEITWHPDGHHSRYAAAWLRANCPADGERKRRRRSTYRVWDAATLRRPPMITHVDFQDDEGLAEGLEALHRYGVCLLRDVPTVAGQIEHVAGRIGRLRETSYGRVFDVVTQPQANNLAYTARGLAVHTDNPYRRPVPGYQLLHCLEASPGGGETILVDGFFVAEHLHHSDPCAFDLLTRVPRAFRFTDSEVDLRNEAAVIETDFEGRLVAIHYNGRSASTLDIPSELVEPYYAAYIKFGRLLSDPEVELRLTLSPGDLLIMNNHRVLHGRTGLAATGRRHLQGCYVDPDEVESRMRKMLA